MKDIVETLFLPAGTGAVALQGRDVLFLNARPHPLVIKDFTLQSYFKPDAISLEAVGFAVSPQVPEGRRFDVILHLFPKNMIEGRYQLAQGLMALKAGGVIIAAAANDAGGARLKKLFSEFGLDDVQEESKNKGRVVWGIKIRDQNFESILQEGGVQPIAGSDFISQAGVFGWDKIDQGSALLARHLPEFIGKGADFGCGYGFLSRAVLKKSQGAQHLSCVDADYRTVELCRKNLGTDADRASFVWTDLTMDSGLRDLDFIIMNPPFHEGKKTHAGIGAAFIANAARALKKGGALWMVANINLPYETTLSKNFSKIIAIDQQSGFKIFRAIK